MAFTDLLSSLRQTAGLSSADLLFLLASALVAGLARGFSGFGGALIFMPLASSVVEPRLAAAVLLIVDAVATLGMVPDAWRRCNRRDAATMAIGALIGIPLGTAALIFVDTLILRWVIAAIVFLLLALLISGWRYRGTPSAPLTVAVGMVSGVFSGAAQIGGPPVVAYWLGGRIAAVTVRANIVFYFALSTVITMATYFGSGLITARVLIVSLALGPVFACGLLGGSRLFGLASDRTFRRVCYGMIATAAIAGLPALDGLLR